MPTTWLIRAARENRLAPAFEEHGVVALGWSGLIGDLRKLSRWEVVDRLERAGVSGADEDADQLISFRDQVMGGDYVVTPDATRRGILVGRVTGPYEFHGSSPVVDPDDGPYQHLRQVEWWGHGARDQLAAHLRKELGGSRLSLVRLSGSGEWTKVVEGIRDAPPPAPRASGSRSRSSTPRARTSTPKVAAPPPPPRDRVCPGCGLRRPNNQFVPGSEVCADCRADE